MEYSNLARVSRTIPQASLDTNEAEMRAGRYGEQTVLPLTPTKHVLADEGSYYTACNPTLGTAIQINANVTAFSDTNAFFVIGNTDNPANSSAKRIYMDFARLILSGTAPTATTAMHWAFRRDNISRAPTVAANKTVITPVNMASGSGRASIASFNTIANAGAFTIPASSSACVNIDRAVIATSLGITGDEYYLKFGGEDTSIVPGLTAVRATAAARLGSTIAPVILEPGEWLVAHMWWLTAATTAASFEFTFGWFER